MAPRSPGDCEPWAFATGRSRHAHVAERSCCPADRLDPTRVPRPRRGVGGTAPAPSVSELRHLLQWGAHAPCTRQGIAAPSTCADSRAYRISHLARRSPSVLRSDGIIGRHRCPVMAIPTAMRGRDRSQLHPSCRSDQTARCACQLWRAIPGAQLCVVPGCAHNVYLEQSDLFNRILSDFLMLPAA